ncbi:VWA domain-containing protein [Alkalihalobacillus oceani]|uniref:VWA domain-containing protein n=1 Tax=Halalkalibacter oceani TaxID=1653776 RepID=A0A9X2DPD8_9BACI|nr:VWA domain-containing protein [Halalkalibacter oceani]MCM3714656.1 VWA domain-containing protein [Halalkalibacter oceani]
MERILRWKGWLLPLFSLALLLGCSANDEVEGEADTEGELVKATAEEERELEPVPVAANVERFQHSEPDMLMRAEPGMYHGDQYDEEIVLDALKAAVEEGIEGEELFYVLLDLVAEDYRQYQDYFDQVEITRLDVTDRPGEMELDVEEGEARIPQANVQVLFDSSRSMTGTVDGAVKMELAKEAVEDFLAQMPDNTHVSLRVYGHKGDNTAEGYAESCAGTELMYPFSPFEEDAFLEALDQFAPTGFTPIAASIEAAKEDLLAAGGEQIESIIYIVSDGEETCEGDPVQAARELHESEINAVVNIIGFDVANEEQEALMEIAEAGGGEYFSADSANQLKEILRQRRNELISEWREWQNENLSESRVRQQEIVGESRELQMEMTELTRTEQERMVTLSRQLEDELDMNMLQLRNAANSRALALRNYMTSTSLQIRNEAVSTGLSERNEVLQEGLNERHKLYRGEE